MDPKQHTQVIEDTIKQINDGVFDNLKALENRIAELVATGADVQQLRPQIESAYREYAAGVGNATEPVRNISADTNAQTEMQDTPEDSMAETALAQQSAKSVSDVVNTGVEDMMSTLVLAGAAGATTQALVNSARGRISGVFMDSNDAQVRRTQRRLQGMLTSGTASPDEIRGAVKNIRERLTGVNTTASLRDLTAKTVSDVVMKFDGAYTAGKAKRAGVKRWRYDGGVIAETRQWCRDHTGETYTEDEIYDLWSSDWSGKEEGDPFVVRGGYNCRHFWVPVEDEE